MRAIQLLHTPPIAPPRPRAACRRLASSALNSSPLNPSVSNLTSIPARQLRPAWRVPSKKPRGEGAPPRHKFARATRLPPPTHAPPPLPSPLPIAARSDDDRGARRPSPVGAARPLLEHLPDLFQQEVLRRLGPTDLASLAGAGRGCAAAVAATALMKLAKHVKGAAPWYFQRLCVQSACSHAARWGNRKVLEWLHNTGCPWDTTACAAAFGGHLDVLQWAREHGCPWDTKTCTSAAGSGHLHVLQWAREHHCPWGSSTLTWAAEHGHLEVLQWAREHGCPWNRGTCVCAARAGQLEVLQWMRENDATGEVWDERIVRAHAAGLRMQDVLTWMDQLSAP